jgi:hypothetical protein
MVKVVLIWYFELDSKVDYRPLPTPAPMPYAHPSAPEKPYHPSAIPAGNAPPIDNDEEDVDEATRRLIAQLQQEDEREGPLLGEGIRAPDKPKK